MNNGIHVSFSILVSSASVPSSGIAGSYGGFIHNFFFSYFSIKVYYKTLNIVPCAKKLDFIFYLFCI